MGECDDCCYVFDWGREMASPAADNMVLLFTEYFQKFSAPPPPVPGPSAKRRPHDGAELARREEKRSRASSSVIERVDDNGMTIAIREHIKRSGVSVSALTILRQISRP
eukprot:9488624-Pyramimonas_sp.AAC.1